MNTEQRITYSVAFKGVIELVAAGIVEFETEDVVAEVIELTDAFNEALSLRLGLGGEVAEAAPKATRKRTRTSATQASAPSGSTDKGPRDPRLKASPAQIGFLKKLLREGNVEFDDGFDLDGVEYFFDEFTMGTIQTPIESLKS